MAKCKATRQSYDLKKKMEVIDLIRSGKTQAQVAEILGISRNSVKTIWISKSKTEAAFKGKKTSAKKLKIAKHDDLERVVYEWFRRARAENVEVDGNAIKLKATHFADALGIKDFIPSNCWYERFKKRHHLQFGKVRGEASSSCNYESAQDWLDNKWPVIRAGYAERDIFNADETGLFFKMTPDQTYRETGDEQWGSKKKKDRVTVMVCANMDGSEKRKLFMIGKAKRPRLGFPKDHSTLPLLYDENKSAWMTAELFEVWVRKWDKEITQEKQKRKILLLIDNCTAHGHIKGLKSIKIEFFPPNLAPILQPMDQGIIQSFKRNYRRLLIQKLLYRMDDSEKIPEITLIDAVFMIDLAWKAVTPTTIKNCYTHVKLFSEDEELKEIFDSVQVKDNALLQEFVSRANVPPVIMDDFVDVDKEVAVSGSASDEDIIADVLNEIGGAEENLEDVGLMEVQPLVKDTVVLDYLSKIRQWALSKNLSEDTHHNISSLERTALDCRSIGLVQKKLGDFLMPNNMLDH